MELVRVSRDVYGQSVLEGASWDLLPYFAAIPVAFALMHAAFVAGRAILRPSAARTK